VTSDVEEWCNDFVKAEQTDVEPNATLRITRTGHAWRDCITWQASDYTNQL